MPQVLSWETLIEKFKILENEQIIHKNKFVQNYTGDSKSIVVQREFKEVSTYLPETNVETFWLLNL